MIACAATPSNQSQPLRGWVTTFYRHYKGREPLPLVPMGRAAEGEGVGVGGYE